MDGSGHYVEEVADRKEEGRYRESPPLRRVHKTTPCREQGILHRIQLVIWSKRPVSLIKSLFVY